ncbi:hypothetical protein COCMIDRAFT_95518 [Bipolaris oryzae ATCC 44560]|uniref:Uncharacterized protein n=1 Tax=Bipolaris oryzae ATCC 44560 TaxID=930090 RepID=W6ZPA5_COCMI|nr:uncharacterized protein COCMIDRAFT_95518 [Bipolaris oryzae ATCC 44560]EUC45446.1 hypothetical protein COCMIDRAFT_95518 [Bipolaris oryzae ATCC 44560]
MIILQIPIFYQKWVWRKCPCHPRYHKTTAKYVAMPPSTDPVIAARNEAIIKDWRAWRWNVYNIDMTASSMKKWWSQYEKESKRESWQDDLWRIWQEEHGFRILVEEAEKEAKEEAKRNAANDESESEIKMDAVIRGVKKIGQWARHSSQATAEAEAEMRQAEDRKRQLWEEAHVGRNASEISLPESFMTRLELWRAGEE